MAEIKKGSKAKPNNKAKVEKVKKVEKVEKVEDSAIKEQDDVSTKVKMVDETAVKRQDDVSAKVKMVDAAPVDPSAAVEMILLKQVGYLPMGSAIQVMPDKVDEYITSGKAKRRNG